MSNLKNAQVQLKEALIRKQLCVLVGECTVNYQGRAVSELDKAKRLILIKGDNSISIHQNRLVRPINYMMNTRINAFVEENTLILDAKRTKPSEKLKIVFSSIKDFNSYDVEGLMDLRLSGSEKDLADLLMQDLSVIEPGLKAVNQEIPFRKGVVDILAEDVNGKLVVIELKRRQADYNSVTQLERYMLQVRHIKNKETRGILVAPSIGKNAKELLERMGLEFSKIDFKLLPNAKQKAKIIGLEKKQKTIDNYF